MRTQAVKDYIRKHEALFWYTPEDKCEKVTDSLLVETILNYGTLEDVKELFAVMGLQEVAQLFFYDINLSERRRNNYHELTRNYFTLFFNRYAQ